MKFPSLLANLRIVREDVDVLARENILKLEDLRDFIANGCDGVTDSTKAKFRALSIYLEYACGSSWKMQEIEWDQYQGFHRALQSLPVDQLSDVLAVDMGEHDDDENV